MEHQGFRDRRQQLLPTPRRKALHLTKQIAAEEIMCSLFQRETQSAGVASLLISLICKENITGVCYLCTLLKKKKEQIGQ